MYSYVLLNIYCAYICTYVYLKVEEVMRRLGLRTLRAKQFSAKIKILIRSKPVSQIVVNIREKFLSSSYFKAHLMNSTGPVTNFYMEPGTFASLDLHLC